MLSRALDRVMMAYTKRRGSLSFTTKGSARLTIETVSSTLTSAALKHGSLAMEILCPLLRPGTEHQPGQGDQLSLNGARLVVRGGKGAGGEKSGNVESKKEKARKRKREREAEKEAKLARLSFLW